MIGFFHFSLSFLVKAKIAPIRATITPETIMVVFSDCAASFFSFFSFFLLSSASARCFKNTQHNMVSIASAYIYINSDTILFLIDSLRAWTFVPCHCYTWYLWPNRHPYFPVLHFVSSSHKRGVNLIYIGYQFLVVYSFLATDWVFMSHKLNNKFKDYWTCFSVPSKPLLI